jgi:hypothetical protein
MWFERIEQERETYPVAPDIIKNPVI